MASVGTSGGLDGLRGKASQDFDLNLAPIIDCFVVLIAFVMISAAFASIGIFDAGMAAGGENAASTTPPPVRVTLNLLSDHTIKVKVSGQETREVVLPAANGEWNHQALTGEMSAIKAKWPVLTQATLVAENTIGYRDVIKTMDVTRKSVPNVLLGGF